MALSVAVVREADRVNRMISRRGAEALSFLQWKSIFRRRCLLMNVFTLRPCASARTIVVLGVVRSTGVGTVISRRGAEFFAMKEHFRGRCLMLIVFTLRPCASAGNKQFAWILLRTVCSGRSGGLQSKENYFAQRRGGAELLVVG